MDIIHGELENTDIEFCIANLMDAGNYKHRLFQSPVTSSFYLFSFNSFNDHHTYENHTIKIISHFNHHLDIYKAESGSPGSVMKDLLPLCTKLKQILALFAIIHADNTASIVYERIDKKHIVSDMLNPLFTDGINAGLAYMLLNSNTCNILHVKRFMNWSLILLMS